MTAAFGLKKHVGRYENLSFTTEGRTLGIIGMGNIGKTVAKLAEAFRMNVIYYNRRSTVEGYEKVDLDTLLKRSDFVFHPYPADG